MVSTPVIGPGMQKTALPAEYHFSFTDPNEKEQLLYVLLDTDAVLDLDSTYGLRASGSTVDLALPIPGHHIGGFVAKFKVYVPASSSSGWVYQLGAAKSDGDWLACRINHDGTTPSVQLIKMVSGTSTTIGSASLTAGAWNDVVFRVRGTTTWIRGSIEVNGSAVLAGYADTSDFGPLDRMWLSVSFISGASGWGLKNLHLKLG